MSATCFVLNYLIDEGLFVARGYFKRFGGGGGILAHPITS